MNFIQRKYLILIILLNITFLLISKKSFANKKEIKIAYFSQDIPAAMAHKLKLIELDKYIHNESLMLFTTQKIMTAIITNKFDINKVGINGHLDYFLLKNANLIND